MKKGSILIAFLILSAFAFASGPTPSVLAAFQRTFSHPSNVQWHSVEEGYIAYFISGGVRCRIAYDAEGNILNGIRYYGEERLPFVLNAKIKKAFDGKAVYGVTEITVNDETVYEIYLQDEKTLMTLRSDRYGNLSVLARYQRLTTKEEIVRK